MKKFKWLSLVLSMFMCFSLFCLTACNLGNLDGADPVDTADYMGGVMILYKPNVGSTQDEFKDGITKNNMTFNQLVDRELSMLADDILFRLSGLYGQNYFSGMSGGYNIRDKENNSVTLQPENKDAQFTTPSALSDYDNDNKTYYYDNGDSARGYTNLEEIESWAVASNTIIQVSETNMLDPNAGTILCDETSANYIIRNFNLKDAIIGSGFSIDSSTVTIGDAEVQIYTKVSPAQVSAYAWNWTIPSTSATQYEYVQVYRNNLRMALSSVLSGKAIDKTSDYAFDQTTYNANISNIEHIGLLSYDQEIIKELIKQVIIGEENVKYDNEIVELFSEHGVNVNDFEGFEFDLTEEELSSKDETFINNYNTLRAPVYNKMHYYKAYELVVDAIMEQIVSNKFSGTDKNIYPEMPRLSSMIISWDEINEGQDDDFYRIKSSLGNINSIIFMPIDKMQFTSGYFFIESLLEPNDFTTKITFKFVAGGVAYIKEADPLNVKIGENQFNVKEGEEDDGSTGMDAIDNSFEVDMSGAVNEQDANIVLGEITGDNNPTPIWMPYDGQGGGDIDTFDNPFTMTQTDSVSTLVNFDGGNNYLEMSFQFYADGAMQTPFNGIPEFALGVMGFEFNYKDL